MVWLDQPHTISVLILGPDGKAANVWLRADAFEMVSRALPTIDFAEERVRRLVTVDGDYLIPRVRVGDTVHVIPPSRFLAR